MQQALERRYARVKRGEVAMPDVLFVDGGPGQLTQAQQVLAELQIDGVTLIGVAKGADRRAGQERLFLAGQEAPIILPPDSSALHLIQRIRDEAHRFAITGHRNRRAKTRRESVLESIPGLGPANDANYCDSSEAGRVSRAPASTISAMRTALVRNWRGQSSQPCIPAVEV